MEIGSSATIASSSRTVDEMPGMVFAATLIL
jgi:hypothetical protein